MAERLEHTDYWFGLEEKRFQGGVDDFRAMRVEMAERAMEAAGGIRPFGHEIAEEPGDIRTIRMWEGERTLPRVGAERAIAKARAAKGA